MSSPDGLQELGKDTPIQFIRFHPDYKVLDCPETPYETLIAHRDIAKKNGLGYVYIGNVPGTHTRAHTALVAGPLR